MPRGWSVQLTVFHSGVCVGALVVWFWIHGCSGDKNQGRRSDRERERLWPHIFVVGAQKCGTTSLHDFLRQHPRLCQGPHKEAHFFDNLEKKELWPSGQKSYLDSFLGERKCSRLYEEGLSGFTLDSSPSYLRNRGGAVHNIKSLIPTDQHASLRFVAILREPVARDMSMVNMFMRNPDRFNFQNWTYPDAYIDFFRDLSSLLETEGRWSYSGYFRSYVSQLELLTENFGHKNVMVVNFDTFVHNQVDTLERILTFLGLDWKDFLQSKGQTKSQVLKLAHENAGRPKYPGTVAELPRDVCKARAEYYRLGNEQLYQFLEEREKPPQEPPFPEFDDPCRNKEQHRDRSRFRKARAGRHGGKRRKRGRTADGD